VTVDFRSARVQDVAPEILYRILWLRVSVFVVEQAAAYPEIDGRDIEPDAELFWAEDGGRVLATARLLRDPDAARIGRVATAPAARGRGLSGELMQRAVARAIELWPQHPIVLDAQQHLGPWYARFGFEVSGERFEEDGIPHVPMRREAGLSQA
jgi:ElaA protein